MSPGTTHDNEATGNAGGHRRRGGTDRSKELEVVEAAAVGDGPSHGGVGVDPDGTAEPETQRWVDGHAGTGRRLARTLRDPGVTIPGAILLAVVVACFAGPAVLGLPDPTTGDLRSYLLPIGSPHHLLGTNSLGNDMLSRLLYGGRVSILIGVFATAIGLVVGVALGTYAGYCGKAVDTALMRVLDVLFAFPNIVLALAIAAYLGPSLMHTVWAISLFGVAGFGRLSRGQTVKVRHLDYVVAARAAGVTSWRIITGHVVPNIIGPVLAYALVSIGHAMTVEAALSYLGLGVPIPQPSWGNLIASSQSLVAQAPRLLVLPAAALFITIASINLLADGLRRRLSLDRD